ncbi:MAG: APC family permease, partial [Steroidobacteraceae bacterium]
MLGLGSATAMVAGSMIGSGIFSVPAVVMADLGSPAPATLCWIIGGLITLCGALTVAELASALPRTGGPLAYLLEAYGPLPAFLLGWTALTVMIGAGLGAMATIFAEYLAVFVPLAPADAHDAAALVIVTVGGMNYLGIRRAAAVMSWTTAAKLIALAALGALALTATHGRTEYSPVHRLSAVSVSSFMAALIPIMWTYGGWGDLTCIGGEVVRPQRTLPLALGLGTGCVIAVYLLVNIGFYHALPPAVISHSRLLAATVAARIPVFGRTGAAVVAGLVLLSTFSGLNGAMMAGPRVLYAMADRGLLLAAVGRVSPRFRTPSVAIWL